MTEEERFRVSVLKIGADGSTLARNIFVTDTRICVCLPSGGITRTIFIEKAEAISLSLAPATEAPKTTGGKRAGGAEDYPVVVLMTFRITNEPVLVVRLSSENEALDLVKAVKQSPYCEASFHTPDWSYVSPTRCSRDGDDTVNHVGGSDPLPLPPTGESHKRGLSTASTQEGIRESKSPTVPSPPSPLSPSSSSTSPGGGEASVEPPSVPQPERALMGDSSFAAISDEGRAQDDRPPLEDLVGTRGSPLKERNTADIMHTTVMEGAPAHTGRSRQQATSTDTHETTINPSTPLPRALAPVQAPVPAAKETKRGLPTVRTWTPPRVPSYWRANGNNSSCHLMSDDAERLDSGGCSDPRAQRAAPELYQKRPFPLRTSFPSAAGPAAATTGLVHSPSSYIAPAHLRGQQAKSQSEEKDQTIAELRRALRMHEDLLQRFMSVQEEAREATAARTRAEENCARLQQSLEAAEHQLDRVSRSFTEVLQAREAELQQQHHAELSAIQDAFDAYDKRMNNYVDQMQKDFQEGRRQWREERQVLQGLLEKQHAHIDSLLLSSSAPPMKTSTTATAARGGAYAQSPTSVPRERLDSQRYDSARERVEARLRTYAENRQKSRQQTQGRADGLAGEPRRAIRTPSPSR